LFKNPQFFGLFLSTFETVSEKREMQFFRDFIVEIKAVESSLLIDNLEGRSKIFIQSRLFPGSEF